MLAARLLLRVPQVPLASHSQITRLLSTSQPVAVRRRNRIVAGASNPQDLSQEARALIEQARDPDDLTKQLGHGIGQPITLDLSTEERTRALQYEVITVVASQKSHLLLPGSV